MEKLLIVVDMQNDFIDGTLGTPEARAIVPSVVEKIKNFNGVIYATLDTHKSDYMDTNEGKHLPVPHCIKGTDGWELNPSVKAVLFEKGYQAVEKPTFGSTDLPGIIADKHNIEDIEIELVGLCTDICVVSNALLLKACFPEIKISVDSNCCAGVTVEAHNSALTTMRSCQINII